MRFGLIHRVMTDALAALGLLALVSSGQLARPVSVVLLLGLALAVLLPERLQDRPLIRAISVYAPVGLLAIQAARILVGTPLLELAVEFAAALQVIRLLSRRGAAHDQQVIVLSLLHLIAGTVLGGGLAYGLCFLGFLVVTPGALVLSHLRREVEGNYRQGARDRTGLPVDVPRILRSRRVIGRPFLVFTCLLSVPIFLFTAALFVVFPRVGLSLLLLNHGRAERMIGFSDKVDLGGVGKLRSDPTIAMRVEYPLPPGQEPPPRLALYLRGTAFDQYNGRTWSRTQSQRTPVERRGNVVPIRRYPHIGLDRVMRVDLEPISPPVLFLTSEAIALRILSPSGPLPNSGPGVFAGPENQLSYAALEERGVRYEVFLPGPVETPVKALSDADRARYLTLPRDLPERVNALARRWVGQANDPLEQARAVERHLRTEYRYDLESPSGAQKNPLDHFLFESRRGHCEFYSTSMAILLRTLGVPTRNVTGFIGGSYNRFGNFYAVRQGDAHSWVEAYIDGRGWLRFDPTPPAEAAPRSEMSGAVAFLRDIAEATAQRWNRHVVGYDLRQQLSLFRSVKDSYSGSRSSRNPLAALTASRSRIGLLLAGLVMVGVSVYWLRRNRRANGPKVEEATPRAQNLVQAVELYRSLEQAMAARGVPRPTSTPPLQHATSLVHLQHPLADDVLRLTHSYLEARFGGRVLTEEERRDFALAVRAMKQQRQSGEMSSGEPAELR